MLRKIIKIDEDKCNGCGQCIADCAEGALAIVDGKAKLVKDNYCDGFGDCIGTCPTGALSFEERDTDEFDPEAVKAHVKNIRGEEGVKQFVEAHKRHEGKAKPAGGGCPGALGKFLQARKSGGCPGSAAKELKQDKPAVAVNSGDMPQVIKPEIQQWPLQLHLVSPRAPYFQNKELVLMSTCAPMSAPDVNWRFVRGRGVAIACPKLDKTEGYVEKLAEMIKVGNIPKILVVRMSVPCCGGLTRMAEEAVKLSGCDTIVEPVIVDIEGDIKV